MHINDLFSVRTTLFFIIGVSTVVSMVALFFIIVPIFCFTTGRKYNSILKKKENAEFLPFFNMAFFIGRRSLCYAMVLASERRRNMKSMRYAFDNFDFMRYASPWDIKISKICWRTLIVMVIGFFTSLLLMLPEMFADLTVWFHNTF